MKEVSVPIKGEGNVVVTFNLQPGRTAEEHMEWLLENIAKANTNRIGEEIKKQQETK